MRRTQEVNKVDLYKALEKSMKRWGDEKITPDYHRGYKEGLNKGIYSAIITIAAFGWLIVLLQLWL
jgi:hypothetical protein